MPIKSDRWIRKMSTEHGMIEPFADGQVREGVISYGLSSYGYDIRVAPEFKVFTNVHNVIVDPKSFDERSFVDVHEDTCVIPPNSFALARTQEYFRIPRDVLVVCVGKSTYARCFRGDTRVALVDGTAPTLEEMARRADDGEMFWGYSIGRRGRVEVAFLDRPRFIGRDPLLEVELDNGRVIRCTPEHEFVLRDGQLLEADALRPGHSLMPLYRDLARGSETVYQPLRGHPSPTHRLADEVRARDPERREHLSEVQREAAVRFWNNGIYAGARERLRESARESWTGERRQSHPEALRRYGSDSGKRERHGEAGKPAWGRSPSSGRKTQAEIARRIRLRGDLAADRVRKALDATRSIGGATRAFDRERSLFRRFPEVVDASRGRHRNHRVTAVRSLPGQHDVFCLTVPEAGNFALDAGVFVRNCGIIVNVTPLEPTWEGYLTLEISNTTPLPAKIYAGEGIAQLLFFEGDEEPEIAYADRKGKYQGQQGVTLPKM